MTVEEVNPVPVTVNASEAEPAAAVVGLIDATVGAGPELLPPLPDEPQPVKVKITVKTKKIVEITSRVCKFFWPFMCYPV